MYQGSCLCGGIQYQINSEPGDFGYCHCGSCQKASGSAFAANAGVAREHFVLSDKSGFLKEFESSPGKHRVFCGNCGSPVYAYLASTPDQIRIRLGTLDTPFFKSAKAHIFVGEKAGWERIHDNLPQFDEWAPSSVLTLVGSKQPR